MRVHFIAIGGSVMHDLAIALKSRGYEVTGSDDEIFDPSYSKLQAHGLLPTTMGWDADKISDDLDAVILGMHAREDNPEFIKARQLGLNIYSFPAFVYEQSKNKQRVVVGGSHGKTTVTAMIVHVLNTLGRNPDYLLGAVPAGLSNTIQLTEKTPFIVLEGDEYPSAATDLKPKFINYHHHIGVITGIAWDHVNVYPSYNTYIDQFRAFAEATDKAGTLIYCEEDAEVKKMINNIDFPEDVSIIPYSKHPSKIKDGTTYLIDHQKNEVPIEVFGEHNMMNISAAKEVLLKMRVQENQFYEAISSFGGANNRMNLIAESNETKIFKDFAHSPSKLKATVEAVKTQFGKRKLVACMELHTYSSLNKKFLPNYRNTMAKADIAVVYYNPTTVAHKRLEPISEEFIKECFQQKDLFVFTDSTEMETFLLEQEWSEANLLLMSSGNFNNLEINQLALEIIK